MKVENTISLIIADDHVMIRLGLEQAISRQSDLKLLATASTGEEAVAAYRKWQPDVLLLDYRMPKGDGVAVAEQVLGYDPDAAILIHSAFDGEEYVWSAANAGVRGYLIKNSDISVTLDAVRKVAGGGTFFPTDIAAKIKTREGRPTLTERELEILGLLSTGMSNKQITAHLTISDATARYHVSNILDKLDADDRTHAVAKAARRGLIRFDY